MKNIKKNWRYIGSAVAFTTLAGALVLPSPVFAGRKGGGGGGSTTTPPPPTGNFTCRASALRLDSTLVPTLSPVLSLLTGLDGDPPVNGTIFEPVIANPPEQPCSNDGDALVLLGIPALSTSLAVLLATTQNATKPPVASDAIAVSANLLGLLQVGVLDASAEIKAVNNQCVLSGASAVASASIVTSKLLSTTTSVLGLITGSTFNTTTSNISILTAPTNLDIKVGLDVNVLGIVDITPLVVASVRLNEQIVEPARLTQSALRVVVNAENVVNINTLLAQLDALKIKLQVNLLGLSLTVNASLLANVDSLINELNGLLDLENELVVSEAIIDFENGNPCGGGNGGGGNGGGSTDFRRMTGGGTIGTTGVHHGFTLHCNPLRLPNRLEINWGSGNRFHLESLTTATCSNDPSISEGSPVAGFDTIVGTGTGSFNGEPGHSISFTFKDAGEPGVNDTAKIQIDGGSTLSISTNTKLNKGNHQAHP